MVHRARQFVREANDNSIPVNLSRYAELAKVKLREEHLGKDEAGFTVPMPNGTYTATINRDDADERRHFTICHEIAHVVLGVPSKHEHIPAWAYAKRDPNERLCDIFAAELLMPYKPWLAFTRGLEPGLETLQDCMNEFVVSYPAAGSRLAGLAPYPCGFVTMSSGRVRYLERSADLRQASAWISPRTPIPEGSASHDLREAKSTGTDEREVPQDLWFENWRKGDYMWELARHFDEYDTSTALLWFDKEELPPIEHDRFGRTVSEDEGLAELTGELPWPGRSKRRP